MKRKKFDSALLKAVDVGFNSLGKSCRQAMYFHLKKTFHVDRMEIPNKVEEFDNAVKLIFKDGAVFLEKLILEELCKDLGIEFDRSHCSGFVETISRIKEMVLERESLLTVSGFYEEATLPESKTEVKNFESKS